MPVLVTITPTTFSYFADIMAYGMNLVQYNSECFGLSDLMIYDRGYMSMNHLVTWLLEHGYSPEALIGPSLRRWWTYHAGSLRSESQGLDLPTKLPPDFHLVLATALHPHASVPSKDLTSADLAIPYLVWYEAWFRHDCPEAVSPVSLVDAALLQDIIYPTTRTF
jgi:hypothetical protein